MKPVSAKLPMQTGGKDENNLNLRFRSAFDYSVNLCILTNGAGFWSWFSLNGGGYSFL